MVWKKINQWWKSLYANNSPERFLSEDAPCAQHCSTRPWLINKKRSSPSCVPGVRQIPSLCAEGWRAPCLGNRISLSTDVSLPSYGFLNGYRLAFTPIECIYSIVEFIDFFAKPWKALWCATYNLSPLYSADLDKVLCVKFPTNISSLSERFLDLPRSYIIVTNSKIYLLKGKIINYRFWCFIQVGKVCFYYSGKWYLTVLFFMYRIIYCL